MSFQNKKVSSRQKRNQNEKDGIRTMPRWDVLVGNAGSDIEHDDTTLAVDIVTISQTAKLFLSGSIPHIELDGAQILYPYLLDSFDNRKCFCSREGRREESIGGVAHRLKVEGVDFDTESSNVFLLEFTSNMALYEGGLF